VEAVVAAAKAAVPAPRVLLAPKVPKVLKAPLLFQKMLATPASSGLTD
jgi:hypothetical protein